MSMKYVFTSSCIWFILLVKPCGNGMTKCDDGIKCIFNMEFCDGREDCFDKSDENTTFCNGEYN
jgi:hypothetical protein